MDIFQFIIYLMCLITSIFYVVLSHIRKSPQFGCHHSIDIKKMIDTPEYVGYLSVCSKCGKSKKHTFVIPDEY